MSEDELNVVTQKLTEFYKLKGASPFLLEACESAIKQSMGNSETRRQLVLLWLKVMNELDRKEE